MGRGSSKVGGNSRSGGAGGSVGEYNAEVESLARALASDADVENPQNLLSNSDLQAAVEAYAMTNKNVDEEKMLSDIRDKAETMILDKHSNDYQKALRASDISVGDNIDADLRINGIAKRAMWTFHPEGAETFKAYPYSDIKVTNVKVSKNTVKVTGLWDKALTKTNPSKSDYGKDFIEVTKTFKASDIVKKRK